jgi:hypothetical protein
MFCVLLVNEILNVLKGVYHLGYNTVWSAKSQQSRALLVACFMPVGYLPEDGGKIFLRNVR